MALVMLAADTNVNVQALGNWFSFKPGQIKPLDSKIAHFICTQKSYLGFVGLPDSVIDNPESDENKAIKADAFNMGIKNRIEWLQRQVNNIKSLQRDFDLANYKVDARSQASEGEYAALKELARLKTKELDVKAKQAEDIKRLEESINGATNQSDSGEID